MYPERVVLVSSSSSQGKKWGTGYMISNDTVLTSSHVIIANADDVQVRFIGGPTLCAADVSRVSGIDIATLTLGEEIELKTPPPKWSAPIAGECRGIGFPSFQHDKRPETEEFCGDLRLGSGLVSKELNVVSSNMRDKSDWRGISGAAMFVEGFLVGVVTRAEDDRLFGISASQIFEHQELPIKKNAPKPPFSAGTTIPRVPHFIGRETSLDEISNAMARGVRVITIFGPPGVGKTAVAREFVSRLECPGGTFIIDGKRTADEFGSLCRRFGWSERRQPTISEVSEILNSTITSNAAIIVDSLNPRRVAEIPLLGQQFTVLITTSSASLNMDFPVDATPIEVLPWSTKICTEYFYATVPRLEPEVNDADLHSIADIVGGLPLAVVLLSRHLGKRKSLSPKKLLVRLQDRFFNTLDREESVYTRGLRATLSEATADLSEEELHVLRATASCNYNTASSVVASVASIDLDDAEEMLNLLNDRDSLVNFLPGDHPWSLQDTIRMYLRMEYDPRNYDVLHHRSVVDFAQEYSDPAEFEMLETHIRELMWDMERSFDAKNLKRFSDTLSCSRGHLSRRGRLLSLYELNRIESQLASDLGDRTVEVQALIRAGDCARRIGATDDAIRNFRLASDAMATLSVNRSAVLAQIDLHLGLSVVLSRIDRARVKPTLDEAYSLASSVGNSGRESLILLRYGMSFVDGGNTSLEATMTARNYLEAARSVCKNKYLLAEISANLGMLSILEEDYSAGLGSVKGSVELLEQAGDVVSAIKAYCNMFKAYRRLGDEVGWRECIENILRLLPLVNSIEIKAEAYVCLGEALKSDRKWERAYRCYSIAMSVFARSGKVESHVVCLLELAVLERHVRGVPLAARENIQQARRLLHSRYPDSDHQLFDIVSKIEKLTN